MMKSVFIGLFLICATVFIAKSTVFAASAEENYKFYCVQCHGKDGTGTGPNAKPSTFGLDLPEMSVTPINHASKDDMSKLSDTDIIGAITDGGISVNKAALMPPWGKTLTEAEIKDMLGHLRMLCKCKGPS